MSLFRKFFTKVFYKLIYQNFKPEIIGYKNYYGVTIKNSRISILSHVSNKKNIHIAENVFIGHFNYIDGYKKLQ